MTKGLALDAKVPASREVSTREAPRILVVAPMKLGDMRSGNRQRLNQVIELLGQGGANIIQAFPGKASSTESARGKTIRIRTRLRFKSLGLIPWIHPKTSRNLGLELKAITQREDIDIVILHYVFFARSLDYLPDRVVRIIDTHDVFASRNKKIGAKWPNGWVSLSSGQELSLLNKADFIWAISEEDATYFSELGLLPEVRYLPFNRNAQVSSPWPTDRVRKLPPSFGIVMSSNSVNQYSLEKLVRSVKSHYGNTPPFQIEIAGSIASRMKWNPLTLRGTRKWLRLLGPVKSLETFYSRHTAYLSPIERATGASVKFGEASSYGVPIIATRAGSQGYKRHHRLHLLPSIDSLVSFLGDCDGVDFDLLACESEKIFEITRDKALREALELIAKSQGNPK